MDNRPIGVFDSGLGGLTAVRELRRILPGEDIIYFGDTGRVLLRPSGTEPLVRVMAEAETQQQADEVCDRLAKVVAEELAL